MGNRQYLSPEIETCFLPLDTSLCEVSGDLVNIGEEDAGITW